jgi:beta-mannosidase
MNNTKFLESYETLFYLYVCGRYAYFSKYIFRTHKSYNENLKDFKFPKDRDLKNPKISTNITKITSGFTIELTTNTLAKNVYLTCSDANGFFNDNYFDMIPGIPKTVTVKTQLQQDEFDRSLNIISLVDSYKE